MKADPEAIAANDAEDDVTSVALQRLLAVTGASFEQRAHLQRALDSRIVIEQAKGILSERLRLTLPEAFGVMRRAARGNRMKLHDLARAVVDQPDTPTPILAALRDTLAEGERISRRPDR